MRVGCIVGCELNGGCLEWFKNWKSRKHKCHNARFSLTVLFLTLGPVNSLKDSNLCHV